MSWLNSSRSRVDFYEIKNYSWSEFRTAQHTIIEKSFRIDN